MRKWVEFSARCGKPNGMLPGIGDEPGRPLHHLFGTLATPLMDKHLAAMARADSGMRAGRRHPHRSRDAVRAMAIARDEEVGEAARRCQPAVRFGLSEYYTTPPRKPDPKQLPHARDVPISRTAATRSSAASGARTPTTSPSPISPATTAAHAHWDMMSFTLHTQGKTLIGDPAAWLYVDRRFHGHGGDHRKARRASRRSPTAAIRTPSTRTTAWS